MLSFSFVDMFSRTQQLFLQLLLPRKYQIFLKEKTAAAIKDLAF